MTLSGGKRKVNKSLKAWVAFVKKVQKEEKLSYKDAIHRAKQRKDKGEKWMIGGKAVNDDTDEMEIEDNSVSTDSNEDNSISTEPEDNDWIHHYEDPLSEPITNEDTPPSSPISSGGKRKKKGKTHKKSHKKRQATRRKRARLSRRR